MDQRILLNRAISKSGGVGISEKNVSVRLALIRQKMKQYLIEREVFV